MKLVDYIQFRQGLPFYDMVTSFMVSLAACPAIFNKQNPMGLTEEHYIVVAGGILESRHFRPYDVYQLAQNGQISSETYLKACCGMLANTAYESVKNKNDHSPEFEFFRHVRNAASHQNKFHFAIREPLRPATWHSAAIDHSKKGTLNPLHGTECFGGLVGMSDLIDLLADIEKN
ncbi:hypothetical protein [Noviherbaspirillum sp.]|uniref:hypothetical protein n=1 Tax=Noviherbaspirillum sp. TaxID=1926288 RepID=UPI002FE3FDB4